MLACIRIGRRLEADKRDKAEEFWKDHVRLSHSSTPSDGKPLTAGAGAGDGALLQVMMDNADLHKHIHLHYQHAYTCENQGDYNAMSMLWLNGGARRIVLACAERSTRHDVCAVSLHTLSPSMQV